MHVIILIGVQNNMTEEIRIDVSPGESVIDAAFKWHKDNPNITIIHVLFGIGYVILIIKK